MGLRICGARPLAAVVALWSSSALGGAAFEYGPVGEPIQSATFRIDLAGLNAPVFLAGHQINMAMLVTLDGASYDMTPDLFGGALSLAPDQSQVFEAAIDPSFFGALMSGRMGLWATLTDTDDASFAIDYISLTIETGSGMIESFYGSANDGFGIGVADNGSLPGAVMDVLPVGSTGTGFDESVSSKSIHVVPAPGVCGAMLAGLGAFARRRRRDAAAVALATTGAIGLVGVAPAASAETQCVWLDFENEDPDDGRVTFICVDGGPADGGNIEIKFQVMFGTTTFVFQTVTVDTDAGDTPAMVRRKIYNKLIADLQLNKNKTDIYLTREGKIRLVNFLPPTFTANAGMTITTQKAVVPDGGGAKGLKDSPLVADLRTRINMGLPPEQQMSLQQVANMLKSGIKEKIEEIYDCLDVEFKTARPDKGPYSVITFVSCAEYAGGSTLGVVEQIDRTKGDKPAKNTNKNDKGWVFLDSFTRQLWDIQAGAEVDRHMTKEELCRTLAKTAAHEFGHLCGEYHNTNWPILFPLMGMADGTNFRFRFRGKTFTIPTVNGQTAAQVAANIAAAVNADADMMAAGAAAEVVGSKIILNPGKESHGLRWFAGAGLTAGGEAGGKSVPTRAGCCMDSGIEVGAVMLSDKTRMMMETSLGKKAKPAEEEPPVPPKWAGLKILGDLDYAGVVGALPSECFLDEEIIEADLSFVFQDPDDAATNTDVILDGGQIHEFVVPTPSGPGSAMMASLTIRLANVFDDGDLADYGLFLDGVEILNAFDFTDHSSEMSLEGEFHEFQFTIPEGVLPQLADGEVVVGLGVPAGQFTVVDFLMVYCSTDYCPPDPDQLHLVVPPVTFVGETGYIESWVQAEFQPIWGRSVQFEALTDNVGMAAEFVGSSGEGVGGVTGLDGFVEGTTLAFEPGQGVVRVSVGDSPLEAFAVFQIADRYTGDVNVDGQVDFADLNAVLAQYGATRQRGSLLLGDANGDELVDFSDLNIVLVNFGSEVN